jgi:hypothetical protein
MSTTRIFLPSIVLAAVLAVGLAPLAVAGPISYGDFVGSTVTFLDVTEDSGTDPLPPALYGPPTLAGDSLSFAPVSFNAFSPLGVPVLDITDGLLTTTILSAPGYGIAGIRVDEAGDYTLVGWGTADTKVSVSAPIFLTILEVNGVGISPIFRSGDVVYSPNANGDFNLIDDPGVGVIWEGSGFIDVAAILAGAGINGCATKVELSVNNVLVAASEDRSIAYIAKKQFGITVIPIPEPSCLTLLGIGIGGVLLTMWRRRR